MATKLEQYTIRPPEVDELPLVQLLRHEVLDPRRQIPSDLVLSAHDYDPEYIHMVAYDDGKIVSTVRLNPVNAGRQVYLVRKMATAEAYRGKGLGSRVLQMAEAVAIDRGAEAFILDARKEAIPFYEKNGYITTGEKVTHTDGIANFTMTKQAHHGN
jgi:predicted GNAT family N-acyltransferase